MDLQAKLISTLKDFDTKNSLIELDDNRILEKLIPKTKDMKLVGECKYHLVNCFEHSLYAVGEFENLLKYDDFFQSHLVSYVFNYLNRNLESDLTYKELLKLGIFMHDIGKPEAKSIDDSGRIHFSNHEKLGAKEAYNIGKLLNLSKNSADILYKYIRYHMILLSFYKSNSMTKHELYDIFDQVGEDIIGIMILGYSDIVSTRKLLNPNEDSNIIKIYMEYILTNYIYRYNRK